MQATAPASFNVKQIVLSNDTFGPQDVQHLILAIAEDYANYRVLREAAAELEMQEGRSPAAEVRLGVCYYLMGRYNQAIITLKSGDGGALALFYLAKTHFANGQYPEANEHYQAAAKAGYNADQCNLGRAEANRYAGDPKKSLEVLDHLSGAVEQTADYLYQRGATVAALRGNPPEVVALYERAVEADPKHPGALFGLASLNERRQQFDRAQGCYQRILDAFPNHPRARLYFKDAAASRDMFYDEDAERRRDRLSQIMNVPVTDFELSVRSRNCLQKMGIMTLGDLARATEQELLSSKNFGETSLIEIKEMMNSKGLALGQLAHEKKPEEVVPEPEFVTPDEQALLEKPIADLNLSVRARKCMVRLGLNTIAELVRRTGDDLLECKNFGVTSLNEVREKLTIKGLKLRGD